MSEGVMADRLKYPTVGRWKSNPSQFNLTLIVWAAIILIVLIIWPIAPGVGVDPGVSTFLSP
jgi:hypothetical protein